jgi:large subunit ribosomal protein L33
MSSERVRITLVCSVCDARNYRTTRAGHKPARVGEQRATSGPLEMKKHCPTCGKHTLHRESK